ncbi:MULTISPECIES: 3'-5' exonuclease [unclassified Methanobrevibacter]|jgi:DNA polymerase I|uniref:3'-5' exonuclease n=2 Tax=unclassified Methanobrevibacter TaxID=2638681 RepID=UPI0039B847C6
MEKRKMIVTDIDYITHEDKPVIRLFGKIKGDKEGQNIIALDGTFEPYLYVIPEGNIEECILQIEDEIEPIRIEKLIKKDFQVEKDFLKVFFKHPQDVPKKRDMLRDLNLVNDLREHDIPFYRRYLIDNDLYPMGVVEVEGELVDSFPTIDSNNKSLEIMKLDHSPVMSDNAYQNFTILSFDLEVYNPKGMPNADKDEIIMIGAASNTGINKVISTKGENIDFVETVSSEKEMIESFVKLIKDNNFDIIVGYNSDNFDFPYLRDRAKILGVDLDLGMDGSSLKFLRRGYTNAATIKGLIHVDLYLVMRRYMNLDRYTLERVYQELFGEEKIDVPGDKIFMYWDSDGEELDRLFDYSLDDTVSTLKIAEQTLPINLELTRVVGQPFFDITRMATGQQAEWYLVRKAFEINEVVPNKPTGKDFINRKHESNVGGYVKQPEVGLHENLVQFDFRSLYPSLIISKNISPDVLYHEDDSFDSLVDDEIDKEDYFISPEHHYMFKKSPKGFIPSVIGNVLDERTRIKTAMKKSTDYTEKMMLDVQQQALKRLANTMYGVYGYSRFRWYSFECAQAITAWGRENIKDAMKFAEDYGFYAIYADTDGFYCKYCPDKD